MIKLLFGLAFVIWYLYSSYKSNEVQKKKKTLANPTPAQKGGLEELMDRMIDAQKKKMQERNKPDPNYKKTIPQKIATSKKKPAPERQFLPFEKRKSSEPREMPSGRQIERVLQREKKASQQPDIKVLDYDVNLVNHDKPHQEHHLADQSKIKFNFKGEEEENLEIDVRKAIIYQTIFERKEY
jgi:hypothetical protein